MTLTNVFAIFIAPFVGSFLGLVIDRLPEGRPIIFGRSVCDSCGRSLSLFSLIPIVSYLCHRGRCRKCGVALRLFYPLIELAALAVAISAASFLFGWLLLASLYLGWSLLVLAAIDLRHKILPDLINLTLIPTGLATVAMVSPALLSMHIIGTVAGYSLLASIAWIYHHLRGRVGLGLGDAKLLAAAGAWLGWPALSGVLLLASLAALTVTFARYLINDRLVATDEIAFGPYLALALWVSWLLGPITLWQQAH